MRYRRPSTTTAAPRRLLRLLAAAAAASIAVVSVNAESFDKTDKTDKGDTGKDKTPTFGFKDGQNDPESPCVTASGKTYLYRGKSATVLWASEITSDATATVFFTMNAFTQDGKILPSSVTPATLAYTSYFSTANFTPTASTTSYTFTIPSPELDNATDIYSIMYSLTMTPTDSKPLKNLVPITKIYFVDPDFKCVRADGTPPVQVPLQYVLPPILGTFTIVSTSALILYLRRRKQLIRELKGKGWSDGPRCPDNTIGPEKKLLVDKVMEKVMPSGKKRTMALIGGKKWIKKKDEDEEDDDEDLESASGANSGVDMEGKEESVGSSDADSVGAAVGPGGDKKDAQVASVVAGALGGKQRRKFEGTPERLRQDSEDLSSDGSSARRSYASSVRSLLKFAQGPAGADKDGKGEKKRRKKKDEAGDAEESKENKVSIFDDDEAAYRGAVHASRAHTGPPDRHTGGSSSWSPPHPIGLRHLVSSSHVPEEKDELRVVRGEVLVVEKYFEDGWTLCRRDETSGVAVSSSSGKEERPLFVLARTTINGVPRNSGGGGYAPVLEARIDVVKSGEGFKEVVNGSGTVGKGKGKESAPGSVVKKGGMFGGKWGRRKEDGESVEVDESLGGDGLRGMVPISCLTAVTEEFVLVPKE
ncbi:hypothetical protein HDU97_000022 [Phlyctochytrium planicorne]|nr:hypothetical protein HDU97_000022 [Phlyctochytrium planicorne]